MRRKVAGHRPQRTKRRGGKPWFLLTLLAVLVIVGSIGGYLYYRGRASLPQTDGSLQLPGLTSPVDVLRDTYGVPHIYAANLEDLARATGYVHAQDRYFQMELARRLGMGRMAEIFGPDLVAIDREVRLFGLPHAARAEYETMDPNGRSYLEAYAEGINAYREAHLAKLPPEFQILGLEPEPWQPTDSLAIEKWMSKILSQNGSVEVLRAHLSEKLGVESAYSLTGLEPPPSNGAALPVLTPSVASNHRHQSRSPLRTGASNAWAASGSRTASGRPLLASDPHLALPMPSLWYEIHLAGGGLNVVGASLPGIPLVIIGHNDWIAWGVTASYADVQDHYLELVNPDDARQYAVGEQWEALEVFSESILVAGSSPETLEIFRTRHGVVVSDEPRDGKILALRWDGLWTGDNMLAFLRINQASNWLEFTDAIRPLGSIPLAFVYADVEGNIGLFPSGNLPLRSGFDGSVPVDGSSGEFEWQGYIPHEEKPFLLNPEDGYIVSANHRILFDETAPSLGADQLASFRAERVVSLLAPMDQLKVTDFVSVQTDRYDPSTEPVLRYLMSLEFDSDTSKEAQALLRSWNGQMSSGAAPAIYQAFYLEFLENTFKDDLGEELFREFLEFVELGFPGAIHSIVDDPASNWWDDKTTPTIEDRSAIIRQSFNDAVTLLEELQGSGPGNWDWGGLHSVVFDHPMGRQSPLHMLFNRGPVHFGGSTHTVANARVSLSEPFRVVTGTSFRMIVELGDWTTSLATIPTGASGHPLSKHYFDQNQGWLDGSSHPMLFDRGQIEIALEGRLTLKP